MAPESLICAGPRRSMMTRGEEVARLSAFSGNLFAQLAETARLWMSATSRRGDPEDRTER